MDELTRRNFVWRAAQRAARRPWRIADALVLLVAAAIAVVVGLAMGWGAWAILGAVCVVAALVLAEGAFLGWRDVSSALTELLPSERRRVLGDLYDEGTELRARDITSAYEFAGWCEELVSWSQDTYTALAAMSTSDANRFNRPEGVVPAEVDGAFNREHATRIVVLDQRLHFLGGLMDRFE
jgi:hypothetical protein